MTHDPLCPQQPYNPWVACICEFLILAEARGYDTAIADMTRNDHGREKQTEHDPLCPDYEVQPCEDKNCQVCYACECDLIANVREDERKKLNA